MSIKVLDHNGSEIRSYSEEDQGKNYKKIAIGFAKKVGGRKVVDSKGKVLFVNKAKDGAVPKVTPSEAPPETSDDSEDDSEDEDESGEEDEDDEEESEEEPEETPVKPKSKSKAKAKGKGKKGK